MLGVATTSSSAPSAYDPVPKRDAGIDLVNVSRVYGDRAAVNSVSLTVQHGEFMTLLGPSGSGKSTTLNLIAGFDQPTSGDVWIHGRQMNGVPSHKRNLGMVFQNYALFPHRTVFENIEYPLRRRRLPRELRKQQTMDALEMVQMGAFAHRNPEELSGGQQQRVALARALVYEPSVLLMDEPLGALDKKLREDLQTKIKQIHRQVGSTFLFVTHDQEEALAMSDRIAIFNEGRIEQVGTPHDLYARPSTIFTATFLGESTMFRGDVIQSRESTLISIGDRRIEVKGFTTQRKANIMIRPEKLSLRAGSNYSTNATSALVDVVEVMFLGANWRYTVRLSNGDEGIVRTSTPFDQVQAGSQAILEWLSEDAVLLEQ